MDCCKFQDLLFTLGRMDHKTFNAFGFAREMMTALKFDLVTHKEYEILGDSLRILCEKHNIPTSNEIASLF